MGLLRPRSVQVECFFCLTPSLLPPTTYNASSSSAHRRNKSLPRSNSNAYTNARGDTCNWRCDACGCWNSRDAQGRMLDDNPAMHDPTLNSHSFQRRAHPSSSRLPSRPRTAASTPFCRNCLTNQTLVMNLLSNYLPEENDSSYPALAAELPRYVASLHERYPQVCASCQSGVDDALKRADSRAQAEVLGRALRQGDMKRTYELDDAPRRGDRRRRIDRPVTKFAVARWRLNGLLFSADALLAWAVGLIAWLQPQLLTRALTVHPLGISNAAVLLAVRPLALFWTVWDPTWLRRARAGFHFDVSGRSFWVGTIFTLFALRAVSAASLWWWTRGDMSQAPTILPVLSLVDMIASLASWYRLRIAAPISLTLVRPVSVTPPPHASPPPASGLASLSLSNSPLPPSTYPTAQQQQQQASQQMQGPGFQFGKPTWGTPQPMDDSVPMDWEPSSEAARSDWDNFGIGKQRMYPAQQAETGLEALISTFGLGSSPVQSTAALPNPTFGQFGQSGPIQTIDATHTQQRGLVLDDAAVRRIRVVLLAVRLLALVASVVSRVTHVALPHATKVLRALLALEAGSAALGAVLAALHLQQGTGSDPHAQPYAHPASHPALRTALYACDAAVRIAALLGIGGIGSGGGNGIDGSGGSGTHIISTSAPRLPLEMLQDYGPEIGCAAWAALDGVMLVAV